VFFAIDPIWGFVVALAAGVLVSAAVVILLKQVWPAKAVEAVA